MEYQNRRNSQNESNRRAPRKYFSVEGTIVGIEGVRVGGGRADGCMQFVSVEDMDGNLVNFTVTPSTYVADMDTLKEGMKGAFYYRSDLPAILIYPPQHQAAVVIPDQRNRQFAEVGYFNASLVNETQTLQLTIDNRVQILTTNHQKFLGSPARHDLVVFYTSSTRSIPAQTTPSKIIVLCNEN